MCDPAFGLHNAIGVVDVVLAGKLLSLIFAGVSFDDLFFVSDLMPVHEVDLVLEDAG